MEPFSITCTTCKSRLKVKSAAAIGQVVPCPKCGGMVLVKPPEDAPPPEVANAATKPVESQGGKTAENSKDFDDVESVLAGTAPVPPAAIPSTASTPVDEARAVPGTDNVFPLAPPPARYGLWLAISILAGMMLAVGVVVVSGWLLQESTSVAGKPAKAAPSANGASPDNQPQKSPKTNVPPVNPAAAPSAKAAPGVQPAAATKSNTKSEPPKTRPAAEKTAPAESAPEREADPLGIAESGKVATKAKGGEPPIIGDDPLAKFAGVLGNTTDSPLPAADAPVTDDKPMPPADPGDEEPAAPSLPRPEPRTVNVAARLADPLTGIEADGVPLADFLEAISNLSTIPITLETDGLGLVKISAASPVTLKATQTTVGKALEEALRPLQLRYAVVDDQLVITLVEPDGGRLQEYPVEDLTSKDDERTEQLAGWTTELVDPGSWSEEEEGAARIEVGPEIFTIQGTNRLHARLLFYFERLRVARKLPLKSNHEASVFTLQTRTAQVREPLAAPISLNFSRPTPLVQILDRLAESAGIRILVDWQAIAPVGWNPDGRAALVVEKQTLEAALAELLTPMELTWRAIDAQTLEVTSPAALAEKLDLEFHPAGDLAGDAAAGEALRARLETALELAGDAGGGTVRFDPASRCLLALLSQPQQRQVEKLLMQWSTEAKAAAR